jgi:hypothetical protein
MRNAIVSIAALLCLTPVAPAAGIDGKWSAEFQAAGKKVKAKTNVKKAAGPTLNLKSDGTQITGSVGAGKKAMTIQDGKLNGASFSFVTVRKRKEGENKMLWSGTLDGDTLRGTRSREGAKRRAGFVAKRI